MLEREMSYFWDNRKRDACTWCILCITSNIAFQIGSMMNPRTEEHFMMASIYMIGSVFSILSVVLYKMKKLDTIYLLVLYSWSRNSIRLLDLEQTRDLMDPEDW